jgi:hypothetical protein
MDAIKKIADIKNHTLTLHLPEDFKHSRVEIIILPCEPQATSSGDAASTWQKDFLSVSCWDKQSEGATVQSWPLKTF